ncbi:prostaglandin G/H synthase 2/cyclooxygenase 2, pgh2/cox2 [Aspergillus luchuensis]|uniref:Prostaglandin G/H synthase 2/cyclooxygenase 2, pgh2/cox2 n=1 Tax=Aspergillus kawachii TaxID=1069201 RepID=A0A146F7P9_ASPKA|nr:prostaglandin G/H synthase 2/cyclooxygenase 2, pgh2/cox2 [Aspergillus luchuensis]
MYPWDTERRFGGASPPNNSGSEDGVSEDRVIRRQQLWRHSVTLRVGSDLPLIWEDPEASHRFLELKDLSSSSSSSRRRPSQRE